MKKYQEYLITWIQDEVKKANANGVVIGISGGIDSAVLSALAKKAFPNNSIGVWIDINSSTNAKTYAFEHINEIKIESRNINLTSTWNSFVENTSAEVDHNESETYKVATGNTKSRLRMATLYQIAKIKNYLVLGSSNRDEIYIGYFTKWGDGSCDIFPLANLSKGEIYSLAKELNINQKIIDAKPSADLWEDQDDESDMGITYQIIDDYLANKEVSKTSKEIIENFHNKNLHKIIKNINKAKGFKEF